MDLIAGQRWSSLREAWQAFGLSPRATSAGWRSIEATSPLAEHQRAAPGQRHRSVAQVRIRCR